MSQVNYIRHLNRVLREFSQDNRITSSHRSLYLAFFELWNQKHFPKSIMVNSKQVMGLAKIRSRTTYHKLLGELESWGYLQYRPSNNPNIGSLIKMSRFDTLPDQKMNRTYPVSEQLPVQKMVSFNKEKDKHIINSFKRIGPKNEQVVFKFFEEKNRSLLEAKEFYNFYKNINWKINGNIPITNWQAYAEKWMLKADEIENNKRFKRLVQNLDHLYTGKHKNYGQPL